MTHSERFNVGDEVWWHVPSVMDHCRTWCPDTNKPTTIIAVRAAPGVRVDHPQLVRVSPNYSPYGDEFSGAWFLPVGIQSHNDPAYRALKATAAQLLAEDDEFLTQRSLQRDRETYDGEGD